MEPLHRVVTLVAASFSNSIAWCVARVGDQHVVVPLFDHGLRPRFESFGWSMMAMMVVRCSPPSLFWDFSLISRERELGRTVVVEGQPPCTQNLRRTDLCIFRAAYARVQVR